jgi:hypothetical protein
MSRPDAREKHHFLLTRLNARLPYLEVYHGLDHSWLERRFDLFERLCVPAVAAQRARFDWLVFCDSETPGPFRDRLDPFIRSNLFTMIYHHGELSEREIAREVLARLSPGAQVLITTRLDSDDGIRRDYLLRIQRAGIRADDEFLNFPLGVQWRSGPCYLVLDASNPFISRVETRPSSGPWNPETVFCEIGHHELIHTGRVRHVVSPPAWLQSVHSANTEPWEHGVRWPLRRPPPGIDLGSPDNFARDSLSARIGETLATSWQSVEGIVKRRLRRT